VKWVYIGVAGVTIIYVIVIAPEVFGAIFEGIGSFIEGIMDTAGAMKGMEVIPK